MSAITWTSKLETGVEIVDRQHRRLVDAINAFYAILIPFVIGGLVLQIVLHLYRATLGR